jgi:predicted DNA-binding transcriptional regulator YafY
MPHIKNALIRYRIIDKSIRNSYRPFPSKQDLREACEEALFGSVYGDNICDSTIEKDLFAMRMEHDAPIKYSKRENGYYYENPNFSINDIPLSEDEMHSIRFAVKTLMQFREVDMFQQFGNAIDKIVDRINIAEDPNDIDVSNFVQFETALSTGGNEFLAPILQAIKEIQIITFMYSSFVSGIAKQRKVIPLLLKEYRNRWYLISHDISKNTIVTYALERMTDFIVTDEFGIKPKDFNPDNFFKYAIGITGSEEEPAEIELKANAVAAKYIQSQPFHSSQKLIKTADKYLTFSLKVLISEEFIRALLSYGGELIVLKPASLKEVLKQRIHEMHQNYVS